MEDSTPHVGLGKTIAILLTCSLSIGSHYASYLLGPLKTSLHEHLHTTNSQFSLLVAAYNINSTWTPLVAGLIVSRIGVFKGAIYATAIVLVGQIILLLGTLYQSVMLMETTGLFMFGIAVSPLSVCQETLIYTIFPATGSVNLLLSLGLLAGKTTAFFASITAVPLAEAFGEHAPFVVSSLLAGGSFAASLVLMKRTIGREEDEQQNENGHAFAHRKVVKFGMIASLGRVFWVYILVNVLGGAIWQPFFHLSSNIIQHLYDISDDVAAVDSSLLLGGAIFLYPLVGWATDRLKARIPSAPFSMLVFASMCTAVCYAWLSIPSEMTGSPIPGMVFYAIGYGMSSLLMVILIPCLVSQEFVSTGLGLHKSMEMSSSTLSQTLSGLFLDWDTQGLIHPHPIMQKRLKETKDAANLRASRALLGAFLAINILQLATAIVLRYLYRRQEKSAEVQRESYEPLAMSPMPSPMATLHHINEPSSPSRDVRDVLLIEPNTPRTPKRAFTEQNMDLEDAELDGEPPATDMPVGAVEGRAPTTAGRRCLGFVVGYIGLVWIVFWATMIFNLIMED